MNPPHPHLIPYAMIGVSHAIGSLPAADLHRVRAIYLFGSVAQGLSTRESDIDIFVDADLPPTRSAGLRRTLLSALEHFQTSSEGLRFKLSGIPNRFSPIVGNLDEWKDVKRSIALSGVQLYGIPRLRIADGEPWFVYSWGTPSPKIRGAFLNALYGYTVKKKHHPGILEKSKGFKIGKSAIALARSHSNPFVSLADRYHIPYEVREFFR